MSRNEKAQNRPILRTILALALTLQSLTAIAPEAHARNGLPTIGGGAVPTCDTTIRGFSVSSGPTRARDQIGLPPAGMIVFAELMWRPCGVNEIIENKIVDEVTGEVKHISNQRQSIGMDLKVAYHATNLKLSWPYLVTSTTYNAAGEILQSVTLRIVTQKKI